MNDKFFGSKLNTVLLGFLILLVIALMVIMWGKKDGTYDNDDYDTQSEMPRTKTQTQDNADQPDYQPQQNGNAVTLDLSTEYARNFKTRLTEGLSMPANFNGHYVVVAIGCGTGCFGFGVVDKNTGKVYQVPQGNDLGASAGMSGEAYTLNSNQIRVVTENGTKIKTYSFDGATFTLISTVNNQ